MAQAPIAPASKDIEDLVDGARRASKRLQNAARDASRALARLEQELEERGIKIGVETTTASDEAKA